MCRSDPPHNINETRRNNDNSDDRHRVIEEEEDLDVRIVNVLSKLDLVTRHRQQERTKALQERRILLRQYHQAFSALQSTIANVVYTVHKQQQTEKATTPSNLPRSNCLVGVGDGFFGSSVVISAKKLLDLSIYRQSMVQVYQNSSNRDDQSAHKTTITSPSRRSIIIPSFCLTQQALLLRALHALLCLDYALMVSKTRLTHECTTVHAHFLQTWYDASATRVQAYLLALDQLDRL